jgi:hypothetical protein
LKEDKGKGEVIMTNYDWIKMSPEEIEKLFLKTEIHPTSGKGQAALQVLEIKYIRMDAERSRRVLWISIIALVISLVGIVVNAFGAEKKYMCVAESATGFELNPTSSIWEPTKFYVGNLKYLITESKMPGKELEIKEIGNEFASYYSNRGFNPENSLALFEDEFGEFVVRGDTGRYIRYYRGGYVHGDKFKDTPFIEIGKCSPF